MSLIDQMLVLSKEVCVVRPFHRSFRCLFACCVMLVWSFSRAKCSWWCVAWATSALYTFLSFPAALAAASKQFCRHCLEALECFIPATHFFSVSFASTWELRCTTIQAADAKSLFIFSRFPQTKFPHAWWFSFCIIYWFFLSWYFIVLNASFNREG